MINLIQIGTTMLATPLFDMLAFLVGVDLAFLLYLLIGVIGGVVFLYSWYGMAINNMMKMRYFWIVYILLISVIGVAASAVYMWFTDTSLPDYDISFGELVALFEVPSIICMYYLIKKNRNKDSPHIKNSTIDNMFERFLPLTILSGIIIIGLGVYGNATLAIIFAVITVIGLPFFCMERGWC